MSTPPRNAAAPVEQTEATKERASQTPHQDSTLEPLAPLVASKRWVGWDGGESRAPLRAPGAPASSNDPTTWATLDEVRRWSPEHFGIVTGKGNHNWTLVAIDVDALKGPRPEDPATPREIIRAAYADDGWAEELDEFAASLGILGHPPMERSPSRAGVHAFVLVEGAPDLGHRKTFDVGPFKVEILAAQYCTVTRDWICENPLQLVSWDVFRLWFKMGLKANPDAILKNPPRPQQTSSYESTRTEDEELERAADALSYMDADDYDTWVEMGMALKDEFGERGRAVWDPWGSSSSKYDPKKADKKWASFKREGLGIGTLYRKAMENGYVPPKPEPKTTGQSQNSTQATDTTWTAPSYPWQVDPVLPEYPDGVLSGASAELVEHEYNNTHAPRGLFATSYLAMHSIAAQRRYRVQGGLGYVPGSCAEWFLLVGTTGVKKSTGLRTINDGLAEWAERYADEMELFSEEGGVQVARPQPVLDNGTPEPLRGVMLREPASVVSTEGGRVLRIINGMYSRGQGDPSVFIKGWDGDYLNAEVRAGEHSDRPPIPWPRLSMLLATHPSTLAELSSGTRDQGVLPRFLPTYVPTKKAAAVRELRPVPPEVRAAFDKHLHEVMAHVSSHISRSKDADLLRLSDGALELYLDAYERFEKLQETDLSIADFHSRSTEHTLRLCAAIWLCDQGWRGEPIITEGQIARAIRLVDYHAEHYRALFGQCVALSDAQKLWEWLQGQPDGEVCKRHTQGKGPIRGKASDRLDPALVELERAGLIRVVPRGKRTFIQRNPRA